MKDTLNNLACDRADELISFLYGEAEQRAANDFKLHLKTCASCNDEIAALGGVRESIALWKTEAFSTTRIEKIPAPVRRRSAVAALREFFALSPLWMKGAVTVAAVAFFLMAGLLLLYKTNQKLPGSPVITRTNDGKYTEQEMREAIAKALENQAKTLAAAPVPTNKQELKSLSASSRGHQGGGPNRPAQWAFHKPLSRTERQQLASDLRSLGTREDDALTIIGDRINEEF